MKKLRKIFKWLAIGLFAFTILDLVLLIIVSITVQSNMLPHWLQIVHFSYLGLVTFTVIGLVLTNLKFITDAIKEIVQD